MSNNQTETSETVETPDGGTPSQLEGLKPQLEETLPLEERQKLARELIADISTSLSGIPSHERAVTAGAKIARIQDDLNPHFASEMLKLDGREWAKIRRGVQDITTGDIFSDNYLVELDVRKSLDELLYGRLGFFVSENGTIMASGPALHQIDPDNPEKGREFWGLADRNNKSIREPVPPDNSRKLVDFIREKTVDRFQKIPRAAAPTPGSVKT